MNQPVTETTMELGNSIACFLARSAAYLDVPARDGVACSGWSQASADGGRTGMPPGEGTEA